MDMQMHQQLSTVVTMLASISKMVDAYEFNDSKQETMTTLEVQFPTAEDVYVVSPKATPGALYDQLHARLSQLWAMLQIVSGCGFENFQAYRGDIQDNYLWACRMAAAECLDLVRTIEVLERPATTASIN